jgi:2-iminobutanoate/2-iminopropanoate deaminase
MRKSVAISLAWGLTVIFSVTGFAQDARAHAPTVEYVKADTASPFPFSDAVRVGSMIYLSGMIAFDAGGRALISGGVEAETRQVMENIKRVLERNGSSLDHVVKCTVVLADIKDWPAVNGVYRTYFSKARLPARTAFASTGLALGARVEIECWATIE